jgi:ParB-like chromosome segregation protein Spo0J
MEAAMPERPRARDRYEHHPLAEMFPLLKDAEFHELVEDIRKHGLREPISLFEQKIIDGRNRERACIKAGVEPRYRSIEFDNHDAAAAYVISKNICRRHLTPKQKRALIEKFLRADPTKSDRQIARAVKTDNKTVGAVRKRAEARGEIPHVLKRTDSKGRSQVAHKRNSANKRTNSTIDLNDQCIEGVRETIERTIKDLRRTGATTFERLFAALVKVIEDIERKTITMRMRNSFPEKREASSCRRA